MARFLLLAHSLQLYTTPYWPRPSSRPVVGKPCNMRSRRAMELSDNLAIWGVRTWRGVIHALLWKR